MNSTDPTAPNRATRRHQARRRVAAVGSAAALATSVTGAVLISGATAGAADYSVTTCDDSGAGSLRQAILDAEATPGADTITISAVCSGATAVAVSSPMEITYSLTIVGPGAGSFVLDGGGTTTIMRFDGYDNTVDEFHISGVTFQHGYSTGNPTLNVVNFKSASISGVDFLDNYNSSDGGAVGIGDGYDVTIDGCNFVGNEAYGEAGALYVLSVDESLVITNSLFADNVAADDGGAMEIYENDGDLTIANTTFTGNTSTGGIGGALYAEGLYGAGNFFFVTVTDNHDYAGVGGFHFGYSSYGLTFQGSIFSGNDGDQVHVDGGRAVVNDHNDFHGLLYGITLDPTDVDVDPLLEPLADNGGPTRTRALPATSPVRDLGPTVLPDFPGNGYDQRRSPYVREYGGRSDMGAYEYQVEEPTPTPDPEPEPTFTG